MALTNRPGGLLVTRGLGGVPTQVIVQGFLPFLVEVVEEAIRTSGGKVVKRTKRAYDEIDEYNISVQLVAINGKDLFEPIINNIRYSVKDTNISISASAKKLVIQSPDININVKIVENK